MFTEQDKQQDKTMLIKESRKLEEVLDVYEQRLNSQEYIGGNAFSIADISHIPYAYCLLKCGYKDLFKARPNVYNWLKRIMKRPAVKAVLDGKFGNQESEESAQE